MQPCKGLVTSLAGVTLFCILETAKGMQTLTITELKKLQTSLKKVD